MQYKNNQRAENEDYKKQIAREASRKMSNELQEDQHEKEEKMEAQAEGCELNRTSSVDKDFLISPQCSILSFTFKHSSTLDRTSPPEINNMNDEKKISNFKEIQSMFASSDLNEENVLQAHKLKPNCQVASLNNSQQSLNEQNLLSTATPINSPSNPHQNGGHRSNGKKLKSSTSSERDETRCEMSVTEQRRLSYDGAQFSEDGICDNVGLTGSDSNKVRAFYKY